MLDQEAANGGVHPDAQGEPVLPARHIKVRPIPPCPSVQASCCLGVGFLWVSLFSCPAP